ncbi:trigger factor [Pseudopontixanthobacter vadosimaris]|uniref:trigger factor n=1 Tax=Pseudopontixanthobacter vadosimaris TaxID=2726450 RepID=UPI0014733062|nr:trigger factor [Pseudopontixanthobacter vadosimaris]
MQINQTKNEGLKRAYQLTIPAADIEQRINAEVAKVAPQVKMPGFRPGKVPANLVRKMHGDQIHAQIVNETVRESIDKLMKDEKLRPAMQPAISFDESYEEGKDARLDVELEVLPEVEAPDTDGLKLERLTVPVTDEQVDEAMQNIASQQKSYKDAPKTKKAGEGDQIIIDFTGSIDGEEFEGGKAEGAPLVIGSGQFIPGFEEQLTGVKTGEEKTITVNFPDDYPAENLKGKEARFAIKVQQVKVEQETTLDDEFAKSLGLEGIDKLRELLRGQLEQETNGLTRTQMKRQLLDNLASGHDFAVPQGMVDAEFEQIWNQLQQEAARDENPEQAMKDVEAEKDDYRSIAERRVRLGLLLSEIGQKNGVEVSGQEMNMLIQQAAQQYRAEDRQRFMQLIQSEPMAAAQLRAPLYEDKVVDFLFDKAEITEREVTREELEAAIEAEDQSGETKPAAKKPAAKKKSAAKKDAADEDSAEDGKAATKAAEKNPASDTEDGKPFAKKKAPVKKAATSKSADDSSGDDKSGDSDTAAKKPAAKKASAKKAAPKK